MPLGHSSGIHVTNKSLDTQADKMRARKIGLMQFKYSKAAEFGLRAFLGGIYEI